jgi:hypothetical protein
MAGKSERSGDCPYNAMMNSNPNNWLKQQVFNPDTLWLRSTDGHYVFVNARPGRPANETVTLPVAGTIVANALFGSNTNQTISTTPVTVAFQTDAPTNNNITRIVNEFTLVNAGYYVILVEIHVEQGANSNTLKVWAEADTVAINFAGTTVEAKQSGDVVATMFMATHKAAAGEVVRIRALASAVNGTIFSAIPAAGGAPPIAGIIISFVGYLT